MMVQAVNLVDVVAAAEELIDGGEQVDLIRGVVGGIVGGREAVIRRPRRRFRGRILR